MAKSFQEWSNFYHLKNQNETDECNEVVRFQKILQMILDEEATPEEEKSFFDHLRNCSYCYKSYNIEKTLKHLIRVKVKKKPVPRSLVRNIRTKLFILSDNYEQQ